MNRPSLPISYDDVVDAHARIRSEIIDTPATASKTLSQITGADVFLKFESFQFTASFKERGALNRLLHLTDEERERGVIAMSAGNHAQGVAYHAQRLGIPATIVMPKGTPFTKVKRTEESGAHVILAPGRLADAAALAQKIAEDEQRVFIHPFDDPLVMAGQGTVAIEFLKTYPQIEALAIPIGGGGLIAGVATAAKAINPEIKVYGVQSESYPSMKEHLAGRAIEPSRETVAEGIAVKTPGAQTATVVKELVEDILIVPERTIELAISLLLEVEKVVVEGAGAAGLAALLQYPQIFGGVKTGLVLCGGNIDSRTLAFCLLRNLTRDGRIARLRVMLPDLPGGLAKVANVVAEQGGNIIEVNHERAFAAISVKYTELDVVVETKDRDHTAHVIKALEEAGFEVIHQLGTWP